MKPPYDSEQWAALLEADPAIRDAWDAYRLKFYARLDAPLDADTEGDGLPEAYDALYAQIGEGQTKH